MKLAFIGNSHVACIKEAWNASVSKPVHFVCGSGFGFFRALHKVNGGVALKEKVGKKSNTVLWKLTHGDDSPFDSSQFDVVVVVGLVRNPCPWYLVTPLGSEYEELQLRLERPPVSVPVWKHAAAHTGQLVLARKIRRMLKVTRRQRVVFIPRPLVREDAGEYFAEFLPPDAWCRLSEQDRTFLIRRERELFCELAAEFNLEVWLPDEADIVDGYTAPKKYSIGALGSPSTKTGRLKNYGDSPLDNPMNLMHKNLEYGALWVQRIHRELGLE